MKFLKVKSINRKFTIGAGIDLFFLDLFGKFSMINNTFQRNLSSELYLKLSALIGFYPSISLGSIGAIEYIFGINGKIGVKGGLSLRFLYNFNYLQDLTLNPYLSLGLIINFGRSK